MSLDSELGTSAALAADSPQAAKDLHPLLVIWGRSKKVEVGGGRAWFMVAVERGFGVKIEGLGLGLRGLDWKSKVFRKRLVVHGR